MKDKKEKKDKKKPVKIAVAKGVKVSRGKEEKMRKKAGASATGRYKNVSPKEFAGASGGASKYSFPINTRKRAKAALSYGRNAPNPLGIKEAVWSKFPSLKKKSSKKGK